MEAPLDIAQFNAQLHSKKDQSSMMAALYALTTISDLHLFIDALEPQAGWHGW